MLGSFVASPLTPGTHSKTNKVNTRTPATSTGAKVDTPSTQSIVARTTLSLEYTSLRHQNHCPLGMVCAKLDTPFNRGWGLGLIALIAGYYAGAILRFRMNFPDDYPDKIPIVQFVTDIFHPLIDQKGYFNLGAHFRPWKPKEHHVYDILYHIKAAFKKYRLDQFKEVSAWNKEAYRYHESTSSFSALATQSSQLTRSESALYDKDHPSFTGQPTEGLTFQKLSPEKLREYRQKLGLQEWIDEVNES